MARTKIKHMWDRDEFLGAMRDALWQANWADAAEEQGESLSGVKIEDVAPDAPDEAMDAAEALAASYESMNGSLSKLWKKAASAPGKHYREPAVEDFGYSLAMMSMGHGVSWFDDHPNMHIDVAPIEFYVGYDDANDEYVVDSWET